MGISSYFVKFKDKALERECDQSNIPFLKQEVRAGALIGILSWLLVAIMEPMNTPTSAYLSIFISTFVGVAFLAFVYHATYANYFKKYHQLIVLMGVLATIISICAKINFYPDFPITHYLPVLMFITIWMYAISGLSLNYAVIVGLVFYTIVYSAFLMTADITSVEVITATYYMVISYFMGAVISMHQEIQARKIFLAHKALEQEKQHHHHKSLHDLLTELPNRELLEDRLHQAIGLAARNGMQCAGLFIDLDKFKTINDQYGHMLGDLYLKEVANRLKDITREADTIARISGDEFFLLMHEVKNEESVLRIVRKIQDNLNESFILADKIKLKGLGASVGICLFPYHNCTPLDIINRADQAMYKVKHLGKNNITFA